MAKKKSADSATKGRLRDPLQSTGSAWILGALVLVTVVVYGNSLGGAFVFDDGQLIQNLGIGRIDTISEAFDFTGFRRLTFVTFGLNAYFGGTDPAGFHLVNVLIHAINVIIVYFLLLHLAGGLKYASAAGALIFAVHPLFTEAVSYISGRYSSLCGTFYFLGILAFMKGLDATAVKPRLGWFSLTALSAVLAWQAKQEALALPIALAAIAWISSPKREWKVLAPLMAVFSLALVFYREMLAGLFRTVGANTNLVNAGADTVLSLPEFFRTYVTAIVGYYLPRFVFPADLSADPYIAPVGSWFSPEFLFAGAVLGGIAFVIVRGARFNRWVVTGIVVLFVSPLTAYAFLPLADVVLEHRAYIPGLGLAILAGWLAQWGVERNRNGSVAAVLAVVLVFAIMTFQRNRVWADDITFWEAAEADAPHVRPHLNLGQQYQLAGRIEDAVREYQHALEINPNLVAASSNIAGILIGLNRIDEAERILSEATARSPNFAEAWVNLSAVYMRRREFDRARVTLDRALAADPNSATAFLNRGDIYTELGDFEAAQQDYRRATELRPDAEPFRLNLAMSYYRSGDHAAAERELLSLKDTPLASVAYQNLGMLAADAGDHASALEYFSESARIRPSAAMLNAVGSTYLMLEMPQAALVEFRRAESLEPGYGPAIINMALAHQQRQEIDSARRILRDFLNVYPSSPFAEQARRELEGLN